MIIDRIKGLVDNSVWKRKLCVRGMIIPQHTNDNIRLVHVLVHRVENPERAVFAEQVYVHPFFMKSIGVERLKMRNKAFVVVYANEGVLEINGWVSLPKSWMVDVVFEAQEGIFDGVAKEAQGRISSRVVSAQETPEEELRCMTRWKGDLLVLEPVHGYGPLCDFDISNVAEVVRCLSQQSIWCGSGALEMFKGRMDKEYFERCGYTDEQSQEQVGSNYMQFL